MREIKFKIWDGKRFWFWGFVREKATKKRMLVFINPPQLQNPLSPEETMNRSQQFTGLKDKNGKEIYEGDVVELLCDGEKIISEVKREKTYCTIDGGILGAGDLMTENIKVIGNKFENSVLLK